MSTAPAVIGRDPSPGALAAARSTLRAVVTPLEVRTLGRFRVLRSGVEVPHTEWQSKKARHLLGVLISRRGRATPRELVMETLWPGSDPEAVRNRLSVALSTLRSVIDPEARFPRDHFVAGEGEALSLRLENTLVDTELFLAAAAAGLAGDAHTLCEAESLYVGDFLEELRYEDWTVSLREEAREMYGRVLWELASSSILDTRYEEAASFLHRLLSSDPYDERAHLELIASLHSRGCHGEADRAYRRYAERMDEIGVAPASRASSAGPRPEARNSVA